MIAVIVPAHDEEAHLPACLSSIARARRDAALGGEPVAVVVVLDACRDGSRAIAAAHGVDTVELQARCVGTARALGAERALALGARWLAFTDADGRVPPDWLSGQLALGADAVCGTVEVDDWRGHTPAVIERFQALYRQRDGHRHVHGANLAVDAAVYRRSGGFLPLRAHEDVALVRRLEADGARIAWVCRPRVITSARRVGRAPNGFAACLDRLHLGSGCDAVPGSA